SASHSPPPRSSPSSAAPAGGGESLLFRPTAIRGAENHVSFAWPGSPGHFFHVLRRWTPSIIPANRPEGLKRRPSSYCPFIAVERPRPPRLSPDRRALTHEVSNA